MDDYYKILGVDKKASEDEIKKAYRKLAHKHHPDKAGGNDQMFKKISEAYQVLSNKDKRDQYDRFGRVFQGGGGTAPGGDGFGGFSAGGGFDWRNFADGVEFGFDGNGFEDINNLGDIFDAFFEGAGLKKKRRAYQHGSDLELIQEITLEEAFKGVVKTLKFKTFIACDHCGGLGHYPKEGFTACSACDGRGEIQESRKTFFGNFSQVRTCSKCSGLGKIPNKFCLQCSSSGRVMSEKSVEINIVPGIDDGQLIKISKAGEIGPQGSEAGDLYVRIKVKPHEIFKRAAEDLIITQDTNLIDLLINRSIEVQTIAGRKARVEIGSNFRFGEQLIISGEGMPRLGGFGRGRLLVNLEIKMPKKISEHAKKLLEDFKRELE